MGIQQGEPTVRQPFYRRTFASVRESRNFRLVWLGNWTEHLGEWAEQAAILWLLYELTSSPFMLTLWVALRHMPQIALSFIGGVIADRVNRRNMLIVSLLASAVVSIALAVLVHTGRVAVWHLQVVALLGGVITSFNHPARQSIVPTLVKKEHYLNAITLDNGGSLVSRVVAGTLTGYIMAAAGTSPIFGLRALGALLAIGWLLPVKLPPVRPEAKKHTPLHDLIEGMNFVKSNRAVLTQVVFYFFPFLVNAAATSLLPVFARDVLHVGPQGYGYMQSAPGVGSLIAIFVVASLGNFRHKGMLLLVSGILLGASLISFALSPWFALSLFLLVCVGATYSGFMTTNNTIIQELVTDNVRGRVLAWREVPFSVGPVVAMGAGSLAVVVGAPLALSAVGLVPLLLVGAALVLMPSVRQHA